MTVIPCSSETYISFSFLVPVSKSKVDKLLYEDFCFFDRYCFLSGGLDSLVTTLKTKDYVQLFHHFPKHVEILKKKGVFPYTFHDKFEKLTEKLLPEFCYLGVISVSGQIDTSEEDIQHANKVWNSLGCKNFGDNLILYLKTDVKLLADVFEKGKRLFDYVYRIYRCHYHSASNI